MKMVTKTELVINYMEKTGEPTARIIKSNELGCEFFPDSGRIYKKGQNTNRYASTWEIKILYEEFVLGTKTDQYIDGRIVFNVENDDNPELTLNEDIYFENYKYSEVWEIVDEENVRTPVLEDLFDIYPELRGKIKNYAILSDY